MILIMKKDLNANSQESKKTVFFAGSVVCHAREKGIWNRSCLVTSTLLPNALYMLNPQKTSLNSTKWIQEPPTWRSLRSKS